MVNGLSFGRFMALTVLGVLTTTEIGAVFYSIGQHGLSDGGTITGITFTALTFFAFLIVAIDAIIAAIQEAARSINRPSQPPQH